VQAGLLCAGIDRAARKPKPPGGSLRGSRAGKRRTISPRQSSLSALVTLDEIVQFVEPEFVQLHDRRLAAIAGRQDISGLVLTLHVHHDPCLVYAVITTEIRVR
jgi:hypothetical protein